MATERAKAMWVFGIGAPIVLLIVGMFAFGPWADAPLAIGQKWVDTGEYTNPFGALAGEDTCEILDIRKNQAGNVYIKYRCRAYYGSAPEWLFRANRYCLK